MFSFKQKTADEMRISDWSSDVCSSDLAKADWWARKVARMPADGIVIAKEAFRLVEQTQAYQGEETASYLFHAFGTNRSEERRVGEECVSTCRARWSPTP